MISWLPIISKDVEGNEYDVTADDLSWLPSAYGIDIRNNKVLLVKAKGKYHLLGGGMELGEDPKVAAMWELKEETGVTATDPKLIDMASSFFNYEAYYDPPDLQHLHSLLLYYSCKFVSYAVEDIQLDEYEQSDELTSEWVDIPKLKDIIIGTTVDWRHVVRQTADTVH